MENQLNLNEAMKIKKNSKNLTTEEKTEIINYLKNNSNNEDAIPYLMKKYNISQTTIGILIIQDLKIN
jgi:hypothetical protein